MSERQLKPDLTGSNESLDDFLSRLRTFSMKPTSPRRRPPDGHFVTNRRPPGSSGGAEAPIPVERPLADLYAAAI